MHETTDVVFDSNVTHFWKEFYYTCLPINALALGATNNHFNFPSGLVRTNTLLIFVIIGLSNGLSHARRQAIT